MKILRLVLYAAFSDRGFNENKAESYGDDFAEALREAGAATAAAEYEIGKAPRVTDGDRLDAAVAKLWPHDRGLDQPDDPAVVNVQAPPLQLTEAEIEDLIEAIDSHIYWQLADTNARSDGAVKDDEIEDEDARKEVARYRALDGKLTDEKIRVITEAMKK